MAWLKSKQLAHKRLAAQLCGIFVAAEGAGFEFRMKELLPEIVNLLDKPHSDSEEREDRDVDLLLIQTMYAIIKICQHCPAGLQNDDNIDVADQMWGKVTYHLSHPHLWIRTLSARLVGTLLGWHKADEIASYVMKPSEEVKRTYLLCKDIRKRLWSLSRDSVGQLKPDLVDNQLVDQVVKNLVFIGKVANRIPDSVREESLIKAPSLPWLTSKLRREVNAEVVHQPRTPTKVG